MSARLLRFAPLMLGLAVLAALVVWLTRSVDLNAVAEALGQAKPWPLVLMAVLTALFGAVRAVRLHVILQHGGKLLHTYHASNIGLMVNCLLPLRSGEMCMALLLGRRLPGGSAEALSRLFVDRLLDLLAVLALFAATAPLLGTHSPMLNPGRALLLGGGGAVAVIGAVWLACALESSVLRCVRFLARAAGRDAAPWEIRVGSAIQGLRALFQGRVIFIAGGCSLLAWALVPLTFQAGMSALFPPPDLTCAMLAMALTVLGLVVAPMPAGIGTTHGAIVLALGIFSISAPQALAFAILYHAVSTAISLLLGMIGLWALGLRLPHLLKGISAARSAHLGAS